MTGVFDGMAGVLNDVFGSPVTVAPVDAAEYEVRAVFREAPVIIGQDETGDIIGIVASLTALRQDADNIDTGDVIKPGNGKSYRVASRTPSGSPASDAFRMFHLEEIDDV